MSNNEPKRSLNFVQEIIEKDLTAITTLFMI